MYHAVLNIVCFNTFSEKHKENELHRKYTFWGSCRKPISSYNFTDKTKFYDFILFTMTRRTASHTIFLNFWIINIWEANEIFAFWKIREANNSTLKYRELTENAVAIQLSMLCAVQLVGLYHSRCAKAATSTLNYYSFNFKATLMPFVYY